MRDKPFGGDLRHVFVGGTRPLSALKAERIGQGIRNLVGRGWVE